MMLALEMYRSLPRHLAGKAIGGRVPGLLSGYAAPLRLVTIDEPTVGAGGLGAAAAPGCPGSAAPTWARSRAAPASTSPRWCRCRSCPGTRSSPTCSRTAATCPPAPGWSSTRCSPAPPATSSRATACAAGATNRCGRITVGAPAPGLQTGFCADTGGGWGEVLTAHRSQLHAVPEGYSDEQAVLLEPMACAVHTALRAGVRQNDRVLVSGAGSVGLLATLAPAQPDQRRRDHGGRQARPPAGAGVRSSARPRWWRRARRCAGCAG